jgi:Fic family protein
METFKAGKYIDQGWYKSYQPELINRQWQLNNMEVIQLMSQADRELGKLDMYSDYIPNIELFISMHVLKEATQSSKIEGTQTNIEEALLNKEDVSPDRRDDWDEVQNYVRAMEYSITALKDLPFSSRLIRNVHRVLMQGVRGEHKRPGEFRTSQNWIGGASINDAIFIPPVASEIPGLMNDIEKFVHNEKLWFPELLKVALTHYQFETIHPFLDGNGRIGRLMITLYLVSKGILKRPVLYLSDFFERNRTYYYDNLMRVREKNDINQWIKFFLTGVSETSKNGIQTFDKILQLQKKTEHDIQGLGSRTSNAIKIVQYLYGRPVLDASKVAEIAGISLASAYKIISDLEKLDILRESTGSQRGRIWKHQNYLNIFK